MGVNFSKYFNVDPESPIKPKSAVPPQHPPAKQATPQAPPQAPINSALMLDNIATILDFIDFIFFTFSKVSCHLL